VDFLMAYGEMRVVRSTPTARDIGACMNANGDSRVLLYDLEISPILAGSTICTRPTCSGSSVRSTS